MRDDAVESLIVRHKGSGVLVDANLLLVYVVGLSDASWIQSFERTRGYTKDDFRLLAAFLRRFDRVITTPNILTEVNNLANKLSSDRLDLFMRVLKNRIGLLDEQFIKSSLASDHEYFSKCGITDAGILVAAADDVLVLTDDFRLFGVMGHLGIPCLNFNHIRDWGL